MRGTSFFIGASAVALLVGALLPRSAGAAPTIAYQVNAPSSGNYDWADPLGLDFDVNSPNGVVITRIGVFDSDQDGLNRPITFVLYNRATQAAVIGPTVLEGNAGTLVGGNRLIDIPDVTLPAGFEGTVVGENYGPGESYYDIGAPPFGGGAGASMTNDGGGLINFVGLGRFGPDANGANRGRFPTEIDVGPANRYSTGTFEFDVVPEPRALSLLGATGVLLFRRRHRQVQ
jgi:hypothetical protein